VVRLNLPNPPWVRACSGMFNRCLTLWWKQNDINGLVLKGRTLQTVLFNFRRNHINDVASIARKFSSLMLNGKVKDAL